MLRHLANVIAGQVSSWNDVFGDRLTTLQNNNNQLIKRVGTDPISQAFGDSEIGISPRHQDAILISKRVLALFRLSLLTTSDIMMAILLGDKAAPFVKVKIKSISSQTADRLITSTCAGLIVTTTVPEPYKLYRKLMLYTLCHISQTEEYTNEFVEKLKQQPVDKYFPTITDNILTLLNRRDDIASLAGVEILIGEIAVSFRTTFVDKLVMSSDGELEKFLTIR